MNILLRIKLFLVDIMSLSDIHKSEFQKINPPTQLFINNQWINSEHNDTFDVIEIVSPLL